MSFQFVDASKLLALQMCSILQNSINQWHQVNVSLDKLHLIIGETTQDTQSVDDSNNLTHVVNTGDSTRIKKGRGKTRGKGLEK
ncbi:hypothetical protein KY285_023594 [Solanum tuberosum]|nr:hypothetical protein KY285_023594 [Solanum tuberosum]